MNPNSTFKGNSNPWSAFVGNLFFSQLGGKRNVLAKFNQISSPQEFSIKISFFSTHRGFFEF
jgi:hypothetical protein